MKVYFDNAATTPLDPEVFEAMKPYYLEFYGNASSTHHFGRQAKAAVETSRKKIAELLNCAPGEVFFTSGGTEADNAVMCGAIEALGITRIIISPIEHHAVLHTATYLEEAKGVQVDYVDVDDQGHVDYEHLQSLLESGPRALVCLMHANNEIGTLTDIQRVGEMCNQYEAFYHSDTVQTMGHYPHDFAKLHCDAIAGSAHKFHGPKGVGFMLVKKSSSRISPLIHGGSQEREMRAGTENVAGIVGISAALEIAYHNMDDDMNHILGLKRHLIDELKSTLPDVSFNGDIERSLYTVLNVCLPPSEMGDMILFQLDLAGIGVSGGSACSAGSNVGSHVLTGIGADPDRGAVRFSFCKYNTIEEIDYAVSQMAELYEAKVN